MDGVPERDRGDDEVEPTGPMQLVFVRPVAKLPKPVQEDGLSQVILVMASLAEFERDLMRERVRSGMAAAKARGRRFGRRLGQRIKSDRLAPKVLEMVAGGVSYRKIGRELGLSKNTVLAIVQRDRQGRRTGIVSS